jgi:hypothetical protein
MADLAALAIVASVMKNEVANKIAGEVIQQALTKLGVSYSIGVQDIRYVLNNQVEEDIQKCLNIAIKAFVGNLLQSIDLKDDKKKINENSKKIEKYLGSSSVAEEISHLLEPGSEFFDRGKLTQIGYDVLKKEFEDITPKSIYNAWGEFLKAFSFASRSTPAFREFLRASYEAGSFRALSNIEDVLEKMNSVVSDINEVELDTRENIKNYATELEEYKTWAVGFLN